MRKVLTVLGICAILGVNLAFIYPKVTGPKMIADKALKLNDDIWLTLMKVKWKEGYSKKYKAKVLFPKFNKATRALNGKTVTVKGHLIPTEMYEGKGEFVVLSALPFKSCFFCGGAGPETVMEVYLKRRRTTFHSNKLTFKGRLELNDSDPDHLIYLLKDAVQVF